MPPLGPACSTLKLALPSNGSSEFAKCYHKPIVSPLLSPAPRNRDQSSRILVLNARHFQRERHKGETTLKEVQASEERETAGETLPAPGGIGMAVAVDWGLAVQTFLTPIIAVFNQSNRINIPGLNPTLSTILFFVVAWLFACVCILFGEMLRRGHNWARWIQIVVNALLSLAGIASLLNVYQSIKVGNFWPLITEVILGIISPLIVWRLSRPSTARWFKAITVAEASKRHGGKWVWFIALWAIVGGVLQTIAAMK